MTKRIDDFDYTIAGDALCGRCAGTGAFITYIENGVPKGPGGTCFRCGGKGHHNQRDRKRNEYYDRVIAPRRAMAAMGF